MFFRLEFFVTRAPRPGAVRIIVAVADAANVG